MTRQKILIIAGTAALAVAVFVSALLLGSHGDKNEPEPTPAPAITVEPAPAPTSGETDDPHGLEDPGQGQEDHDHDHDVTDCETGPIACEGAEDVIRYSEGDKDVAALVRPLVAPFVTEWTTIDSDESAAARTARLIAAGATPEAAGSTSVLARASTHQTGLSVSTAPRPAQRILFLGREDGLLKFQASLDVSATYMQPDDSGSRHVAGGAVNIYLSDSGAIVRVTDSFPTIEALR